MGVKIYRSLGKKKVSLSYSGQCQKCNTQFLPGQEYYHSSIEEYFRGIAIIDFGRVHVRCRKNEVRYAS